MTIAEMEEGGEGTFRPSPLRCIEGEPEGRRSFTPLDPSKSVGLVTPEVSRSQAIFKKRVYDPQTNC